MKFKIDTGADVSVIPSKLFSELANSVTLKSTNRNLLGPCNYKFNCISKSDAKLMSCNDDEIFAVDGLDRPLLGRKACKSLNPLQNLAEIKKFTNASSIMQQYLTLSSGLYQIEGRVSHIPQRRCNTICSYSSKESATTNCYTVN